MKLRGLHKVKYDFMKLRGDYEVKGVEHSKKLRKNSIKSKRDYSQTYVV